jgi:hypothetical protein
MDAASPPFPPVSVQLLAEEIGNLLKQKGATVSIVESVSLCIRLSLVR